LVQPVGPYYFFGFSFGGIIAYEMACQLIANGEEVNFIGLLDTYLVKKKLSLPLSQYAHKFLKKGFRKLYGLVRDKIKAEIVKFKYGTKFWPLIYTSAPDIACRKTYQPKVMTGRVILFEGDEMSGFFSYEMPEKGWRELIGDSLEVQRVTGTHFEMCQEPHVQTLAEKILACMDRAISQK